MFLKYLILQLWNSIIESRRMIVRIARRLNRLYLNGDSEIAEFFFLFQENMLLRAPLLFPILSYVKDANNWDTPKTARGHNGAKS